MRIFVLACLVPIVLAFSACDIESETQPRLDETISDVSGSLSEAPGAIPAGTYKLEPSHASLIFRVDHLGFSMYTARFVKFDATLEFDPQDPGAASVVAVVDATSLETDYPYTDTLDFNAELKGPQWLDAAQFPEIRFQSRAIELSGGSSAIISGDLTLHGVTKPVSLNATFNGGYAGHPMDPNARIGFSAAGVFKRSEFGIVYGIPPVGSRMGVGDAVEVIIEAEFTGPAWTAPTKDDDPSN